MANETDVLVETPREYTTVSGAVEKLPPVTWGTEIRVLRVIKEIINETVNSGIFQVKIDEDGNEIIEDDNVTVARLLSLLFETAPDRITEAASALTGKDKPWIEENLVSETIIEILVPFLRTKQESVLKTLKPYTEQVRAAIGQ